MKGFMLSVLLLLGVVCVATAAEKAACPVCVVKEGKAEPEEVKAQREFEGARYAFCSDKCAKEFDADPASYVPPVFPRPAPALALKTLAGEAMTWESLRGRVVLVDFWATWCAPCKKSMPELQALQEKYGARGLTVLGVSIDEGGPAKVKKYVEGKKFTYPIAVDAGQSPLWEAFRVKAVPAAFLVDGEGRIVAQWTGRAPTGAEVEAKVEEMLKKREG